CRPVRISRMKSGWKSHPALPRSLRSLLLARQSYSLLLTAPARQLPAAMLVQHIDQLVVKRRDIVRLAAADPVAIDDHFFIHPVTTGIADIVLQRRPAGHGAPFDQSGRHQYPAAVADHEDRLAGFIDLLHEPLRRGHGAQLVAIDHAARE